MPWWLDTNSGCHCFLISLALIAEDQTILSMDKVIFILLLSVFGSSVWQRHLLLFFWNVLCLPLIGEKCPITLIGKPPSLKCQNGADFSPEQYRRVWKRFSWIWIAFLKLLLFFDNGKIYILARSLMTIVYGLCRIEKTNSPTQNSFQQFIWNSSCPTATLCLCNINCFFFITRA